MIKIFVVFGCVIIIILLTKCFSSPVNNSKRVLAIDTESVGGGVKGSINILARVSIVDRYGNIIYDEYVKPIVPVTHYRTTWSGITEEDLIGAQKTFYEVIQEVSWILKDCVLVGHDLQFDLTNLNLIRLDKDIRDTALYRPFRYSSTKPSLKVLAKKLLNRDIQVSTHSSVEDARAAMDLYLLVEQQWEKEMASLS